MGKNDQKANHLRINFLDPMKNDITKALMENFPDIVLILDKEGVIVKASKNTSSYFNINSEEELIGKSLIDLTTSQYKDYIKKDLDQLDVSKSIGMVEYEFNSKSGTNFIGELSVTAFSTQKSDQKYFLGIIRDITNQKIIEIELRENKQMFQLVMDNIPQLISWKDVSSTYLGCNKNFARVAGLSNPKEILGKTDYELPWKISEAESFFEIDQYVMDTDKPEYHIIEPQLQADGKQAWLDTNKIPLHNSKEEVMGILCTYEDITERVNSEIALKNSEKKYKEAYNRAEFYKDVFAHDVSNILQGILSSVELCRFTTSKSKNVIDLDNLFDIIEDQVNRGANLVSNIRKISTIDNINRYLEKVEVCEILKTSIENIKKRFPKREIEFTFESNYDKLYARTNHLISDVFNNILYNAVKHNSQPKVRINIQISKETVNDEALIKFQFKDNGVGIQDSQKLSIFTATMIESQSFNRLGLGLSLVKKLIENYSGKIWVEDRVEGDSTQGSNFILMLKEWV
ncbi:MAG: PAS domain-containing sensor histidine kinase [Promethearchaeota archaeon]|nr:MAG: PAS domain-containing sensor histidine kinase [Candidatus Lokiarchaeota archaeon]